MREILIAAALIAATPVAHAQPSVPPSVAFVVTGGSWQTAKASGQYRVVVEEGGWEHVTSRVYAEWIAIDADHHTVTIAASVPIRELGGKWSVGLPKFNASKSKVTVELPASNSFDLDAPQRTFIVELGVPGQYRVR